MAPPLGTGRYTPTNPNGRHFGGRFSFPEANDVGDDVDWTVSEGTPEFFVTCRCRAVFVSHARMHFGLNGPVVYTRKPCPRCGGTKGAVAVESRKPCA